MLPTVKTLKTSAIATVLAISLAIPAAPAMAWGQREQDVLKGVLGAVAVGVIINEVTKPKPQPVYRATKSYAGTGYNQGYNPGYNQQAVVDASYNAAKQAFNSYTSSERRNIQRDLQRRGFYHGAIDGAFGQQTYRATAAYARATGNLNLLATRNGAFGIYDSLV